MYRHDLSMRVLAVTASVGACLLLARATRSEPGPQIDKAERRSIASVSVENPGHHYGGGGGSQAFTRASFGGTPYTVSGLASPTTTVPEAEEEIAVDPLNPANVVAAISDFALRGGYNTTKYVVSTDGAATWREAFVPLNVNGSPVTSDGLVWLANSDPVVAVDRLGNVFLSDLYLGNGNANGLYVSVATLFGGVAFTAATTYPVVPAHTDPRTTTQEDKPWIAVDDTTSPATTGNVYVSWTRFSGNSDTIYLSRSLDHGRTWSVPLRISPAFQDGGVQGSQVAVGPGGEVWVAYEVFYVGNVRQQFLAKSTDGGVSFTSPIAITPAFNELAFSSTYRTDSFCNMAVRPDGKVVLVYSDYSAATGAEVELVIFDPVSTTASAPVVINDVSTGQQFFPAVSVDGGGTIHASWFDTRNSGGSTALYDVYATHSADGVTFAPNARVTPKQADAGSASFIGDYAGIASANGKAFPVWNDGGFNGGSLKTAVLSSTPPPPPPAAPTGLTAKGGNASVSLVWSGSAGASSYDVKRGTTSGGPYATIAPGVAATSFVDGGVVNGTTYFYVVTALNAGGESPSSNEASATPQGPPPAPTGLTAKAGNGSVSLAWTASSGAASYDVKRGTTSGGPYDTIATGVADTTYPDTTVTNGTTYFYVVTAVNALGESASSNQASATPSAPPAAPTGLTATPSNHTVTLRWNASSGASTYNVKRGTTSGGPYTTIATGVTGTSYVSRGLSNGTTYYFVVTAVNAGGESPSSNQASATPRRR
jgi:fibronectin type 3 domain-containing protein